MASSILGKLGLSEWANSFGSPAVGLQQPHGPGALRYRHGRGPVAAPRRARAPPATSALAALTIGTETSGSIISPSTQQSLVGLRPTVGLVPGYGIAPIDVSQDTAGPMVRTVEDSAILLQSIAEYPGSDATANQEYLDLVGPNYLGSPPRSAKASTTSRRRRRRGAGRCRTTRRALDLNFVKGKRIGYNGTTCTPTPACTLTAAAGGQPRRGQRARGGRRDHGARRLDDGRDASPRSRAAGRRTRRSTSTTRASARTCRSRAWREEVALDNTNPQEATKDGNSAHANESLSDDTTITNPFAPTRARPDQRHAVRDQPRRCARPPTTPRWTR